MNPSAFLAFLPVLLGLTGGAPLSGLLDRDRATEQAPVIVERVQIAQSELILRIPLEPRISRPIEWKERKGPKCLAPEAIAAAVLSGPDQIDFLMYDRRRVRAKLAKDCLALDFYGSFYLSPEDDNICAGRDMIRSRMGGSCKIERFHQLVPTPRIP